MQRTTMRIPSPTPYGMNRRGLIVAQLRIDWPRKGSLTFPVGAIPMDGDDIDNATINSQFSWDA